MDQRTLVSLQLNDSYKPIIDGVAVAAENYARWLHRRGMAAAVAAPAAREVHAPDPGNRDGTQDEFPVFRYASVPIPGWAPYRAGLPRLDVETRREIVAWMNAAPSVPVILHSHAPFASHNAARTLRRQLIRTQRPVVHIATLHSKYREDLARSLPPTIVEGVITTIVRRFHTADEVWTPNAGTARTLRNYGFDGPITVVPNGSDLARPTESEYDELRRRGHALLGFPDSARLQDPRVLLFVGQHRFEKNVRLILEAIARLSHHRDVPPWRFVFVGAGRDKPAMIQQGRSLSLDPDHLQFYGHVSDRRELKALYARSDLFVFPSLYDNAPLVVREAAAFFTPSVLAAGSDAAGDTVDGRNAFHVTAEEEPLAAAIAEILRNPQRLRDVGLHASREVFRSWSDVVADVHERYRAAAENAPVSSR